MATLSLRMSEDELRLIKTYTAANGLSMSAFVRDAVLDKIEDDFNLDEERILKAREAAHNGKLYSFEEAWKEIGV